MKKIVLSIFACFVLSGCGTTYFFNKQAYYSQDSALSAQHAYYKDMVDGIQESSVRVDENVLVLTPSKKTSQSLGVSIRGTPNKEIIDYLGESLELDYASTAECIKKSKIFRRVDHRVVDFPLVEARKERKDYGYVVFMNLVSPEEFGWILLKGDGGEFHHLHYKDGETGVQRMQSLMDAIAREVVSEK